ncbi:MAG: hypothetical protein LAO78_00585 [Acidobacteriia bacterium]|nr:hypothetical protein [Terriglobia bacterium]
MWPLSFFLFFATAAPQQKPLDVSQDFLHLKLPVMQHRQFNATMERKLIEESQRNTCYTMRSYFFRRQDGLAPVPAGMTTCTPASVLQQRQVSPGPPVSFKPVSGGRERGLRETKAREASGPE